MSTRLDHATVMTCRNGTPVALEDTSITWSDGAINSVEPTASVGITRPIQLPQAGSPLVVALRGKPLGRILVQVGLVTGEEVEQAVARQQARRGVIGQILVDMGAVHDWGIEWARAVQAGRDPVPPPKAVAPREIIDGRGRLVLPGLVNTHHHLFQSLTRCLKPVQDAGLFDWLTTLYGRWQHLDRGSLHMAASISLAELITGGCTTTSDHMYLFPRGSDVALEAVLEAAEALGIRIHACRGSMTMGQSLGGLPPDSCVEDESAVLADCERLLAGYHDPRPHAMRRIDLAPCAPFNVSREFMGQTKSLAEQHNVLLHTHIAETLGEERFCMERFGVRPVEYARDLGWLGPRVYLAHCVHLNDGDIRLLAESGTAVAHCPCSNMRLGSGMAPVRRLPDAGIRVGLGVDGSSSNDGGNLLNEARQALLLQRVAGGAAALKVAEAFKLATIGGADALGRSELGRIEPGAAADLAIYDAGDIAFAGAIAQDPLGAVILCQAPRPRQVIVAGRTVLIDGCLTTIDLPQLIADFNQMVAQRFR